MQKVNLILFIFFCAFSAMNAQSTFQPKQLAGGEKGVIYEKERNFQFRLHTNGVALGYMLGEIVKYDETNYYTFEFGFLKHPQQYRQPLRPINNAFTKPYTYGKVSNFMQIRVGYKKRKYLSEKAKRNGIAIGYSYEIGAVAGMEKPYYLRVQDDSNLETGTRSIKYSDDNDKFLNQSAILGSANFFTGLGEMKFVPGLSAKFDMVFAWGAYDKFSRSIEAGVMVDLFTRTIDIMANEENTPLFINFHINFVLGNRR